MTCALAFVAAREGCVSCDRHCIFKGHTYLRCKALLPLFTFETCTSLDPLLPLLQCHTISHAIPISYVTNAIAALRSSMALSGEDSRGDFAGGLPLLDKIIGVTCVTGFANTWACSCCSVDGIYCCLAQATLCHMPYTLLTAVGAG